MTWSDASRIDGGTFLLLGTGTTFGSLLDDTGPAQTIGEVRPGPGPGQRLHDRRVAVVLAIVICETTPQHGGGGRRPYHHPARGGPGLHPFVPALAATFTASFGFMLPVPTPQNAIVYGCGVVPITKMIRSAISFVVLGALLLLLLPPLMVAIAGLR